MNIEDSPLEKWLRKKNMSTKQLSLRIGCTRIVIWKVKRGMAICSRYAKKIIEMTEGEVTPVIQNVGRQSFK